jgi:23S rRNA (cytidine1920-2'-O)/16S rRNA (cytidine1409-2'-O)-methyltransferase
VAKRPSRKKPSQLDNLPAKSRYVSRGGDKLRGALDIFSISTEGKICLDVGSSTGGFTDCLLQTGAKSVWAVDVGWGLLDYKLRKDPRVHVLERTNFRFLETTTLSEPPQFAVVDVSFISLDKIFPKLMEVLTAGGEALVLVKPQFEGIPKEAPGGIVRDEEIRQKILAQVQLMAKAAGFKIQGLIDSSVRGRKGNQETFLYLRTDVL